MHFIKHTISWLCLYLIGTSFFLTANAFVLNAVLQPDTIKESLKEQGTYEKVVPTLFTYAQYPAGTDSAGTLPLDQPWVKDIANKAFTPEDVEQQSNTAIDGVFNWLNGETAQPTFTIDLTENKQQLANEAGNYVSNRYSALPPCTIQNLPSTIDPYRIECRPPGVSANVVSQNVSNDILTSQDFLKDPSVNVGSTPDQTTAQLDSLPAAYQNRGLLLWMLPLITVLFTFIGIGLADSRTKALRSVALSLIFGAIGLLLFALLITFGVEAILKTASQDAVTRDIIGPIIIDLMKQARTIYINFAIGGIGAAIVFLIIRRKLLQSGGEGGIRTLGTQ